MCGAVWVVRYGTLFIVWFDRLINTHIAKLLSLISCLLWLFDCLPACMSACTFMCVNARVSLLLLLLLFLFVFLCLLYMKGLSDSFTHPSPLSLYFFPCLPPFVHPPPSFVPSPYPLSLPLSIQFPCDFIPTNSYYCLTPLHSPSLDYPPSRPCTPCSYLSHIHPAHPYYLLLIEEHIQIPCSWIQVPSNWQWQWRERKKIKEEWRNKRER